MNPLRDAFAQFPYPSSPRAATAPDRLAAVARLFATTAPNPETARALEIGCSDGGNLLSLATITPQGRFLGIDFSEPAIARGQGRIRELQINNIELRVVDLFEFPADAGTFDYIIAHGVYSWVAPQLQERLLALIQRHLAPDGVAYVDYNAQPGSQIRFAFRESLLFHVRRFTNPQQRIDQARSFMKLIVDASPDPSLQRTVAEAELRRLLRAHDTAIFHDLIALENHPIYFHEFVSAAARYQLQYLAEANVFEMSDGILRESVRERLAGLQDIIEKEQYLDILKGRAFRQTLLCHAGRSISRLLDGTTLEALYFSASVEAAPGPQSGEVSYRYEFGTLTTANVLLKEILDQLANAFPARLSARELAEDLRARRPDLAGNIDAELQPALLYATMSGVVGIHARPGQFSTTCSVNPLASALARFQAQCGEDIYTLNLQALQNPHQKLRQLLPLLDGTRDVQDLARSLGWEQAEVEEYLRGAATNALLMK
jgi:SAM-dependent methyltransferase/methyltransferase-like protein